MLQRLFGRLVLLVVVVLGLWFVISHYHGTRHKFGCAGAVPPAMLHAESDSRPASLGAAAADAGWATNRLATLAGRHQTAGLFYDVDGTERDFASGQDADEKAATEILRDLGIVNGNASLNVAAHVEVKVATMMHRTGLSQGVLVINRTAGVCGDGKYSCAQVVRMILSSGARLIVWSPREIAQGSPDILTGGLR